MHIKCTATFNGSFLRKILAILAFFINNATYVVSYKKSQAFSMGPYDVSHMNILSIALYLLRDALISSLYIRILEYFMTGIILLISQALFVRVQ